MTFEDTLATWLVKQRWFAGKGRTVHDLAVVADTEIIPGDPGLRHLMVTVSHGATSDCYQLFIGYRARLPARLRHARIGAVGGLQIYDGLHDTALTRALLDAIVDDRSVGMLRFCRMPGAEIEAGLDSLVLTGEQSNTSLVFGESAIFKVFRRVNPGPNPDLEVASALAELGSSHIAEPFGWVETRIDGASTVLAILSRYLRAASDGWALAATSVRDLYASEEGTRAADWARPPRRCTGTWPRRSASPSSSPRPSASWPSRCTGGSTWRLPPCRSWDGTGTRSATRTRTWPS